MKYILAREHLPRNGLVAVVLLGLFLRLWRLDFGMELPYLAHTDEPTQYNPAIQIVTTGDLNPHFFNYPSLTIYLDAIVLYVGFWVGRLCGAFDSLADLRKIRTLQMAVGLVGTPQLLLLGRATTAAVGTLTVGLVYALTKHLARRKWVPHLAALLLAVSRSHVQLSHYMTVDVTATFFAVASVAACTLALAKKEGRFLWAAAICGGLATSSKYNYVVLAIPVGLTCVLDPSARMGDKVVRTLASGALFCLAFALTSPYVLLDFDAASRGILREIEHYARGHLGVTGSSFLWYLGYLWQVNPFYLLLGVPGIALAVWRERRAAVPLAVFVALYYGLIGRQAVHFDRNVLPVMVLLIVGAGVAVDALFARLPARVRDWRFGAGRFSVSPTMIGVALPLLPSLLMLPAILQFPSPSGKALAQAWFARALETPYGRRALDKAQIPTLTIAAEAYTVYLDPEVYDATYYSTITKEEYGLLAFQALGYDIVILGSGMFHRFYDNPEVYAREVRTYDAFFERVPDQLAFEKRYDPLEFREGGSQVYVFFLTEEARRLKREMEGAQSE